MPGHGSPWKFLLDTGMEHLSLPRQACKAQETDQNVQIKGNRKDYTSSGIKINSDIGRIEESLINH